MKKKLLALFCIFALLSAALCGCGAVSVSQETAESYSMDRFSVGATEPQAAPMEDYGFADGMTTYSSATEEEHTSQPVSMTEKIIYSADVQMETMEFSQTVETLEKAIGDFGGFTENSEINGDTRYLDDGTVHIRNRHAYYKIRIPAEKLDDFLHQTGSLGNVVSSSKSAQNVTSQYTDFEARRTSLQTQEARLLELIAEADNIDALITLESKLSEVRYEIESIQRNLNDLDSKIVYSTVDLYVREVEVYEPTPTVQRSFWQRMGDAFARGWRGFVRGIENFFVWLSGAVFTLILLVVVGIGVFFVIRTFVRKKKAKKAKNTEDE